ncbi:MAG: D-alanine--D-alanine ligase [Coriobacteriales bacterium]|nr:D-alanine--D-alanine ligase [Coriobacteriales bacterium]
MFSVKKCDPSNIKVALLKGGNSGEREISLKSGAACSKALKEVGFEVIDLDTKNPEFIENLIDLKPDVCFLALHGKYGEDGCVQGVCEMLGIPYTGSNVLGSAVAMDKAVAKILYEKAGLSTPKGLRINRAENFDIDKIVKVLGEHVVVKPTNEGSTLGLHMCETKQEIEVAINQVIADGFDVIAEEYVSGIETTVAVLGNDDPVALPVIEIVPQGDSTFYDFTAKYAAGGSKHIIPARLSEEQTKTCQDLAMGAHKVLGCQGVSRTDIIVGESKCWILETNTLPGMTETSLLPDAASKIGISFNELCKLLVEFALEAHSK